MCTGYLADQIEREFGNGDKYGVTIEYSREPSPLGTGGTLKWARNLLEGLPYFLVMNGDSFLEIDFEKLIELHRASNAIATIAVVPVENDGRYGTVQVDSTSRVTEFKEKTGIDTPGLINGGVYVFSSAIFAKIPDGATSLEKDVFPEVIGEGLFALRQQGTFIDIGTPLDYEHAQRIFDRLNSLSTHGASHLCDEPKS